MNPTHSNLTSGDSLVVWATRRMEILTDGNRSATPTDAEVRMKRMARDVYPACTKHGAINKVGGNVWRCLAEGCNVGCRYPVPFDNSVLL